MALLETHPSTHLLDESLRNRRIHSAYLIAGARDEAKKAAIRFARGLVCTGDSRPCNACSDCERSGRESENPLDGSGKKGPLMRHLGDHPNLLWVERGADDTRVRIGQIRALQNALRLRADGASTWRAAVIADAEWLNQEAQNALLRVLEEPPDRTSLILVAQTSQGLLATLRSRCQRVLLPRERAHVDDASLSARGREWLARLPELGRATIPELLDDAEAFRGARGPAAEALAEFLEIASLWLRDRTTERAGSASVEEELRAWKTLQAGRKSLAQRNANPQMVAERAILALHHALRARG